MGKWNYETCAVAAARFSNKRDFRKFADPQHQWLRRNGLLDQACAHMDALHRQLSDEDLYKIASQYTHKAALKKGDQSVYNAAKKRGILDNVCAHMEVRHRALTDAQISELALQYKTRSEFADKDYGAYQTATKRGILDQVCAHMDGRIQVHRTNEQLAEIAKCYQTRNDFGWGNFGAYSASIRRGILDEICAHMKPNACGFRPDMPACVYQFRLELPDGQVVYKVGITNRKPSIRLTMMGLFPGVKAELTHCIKFAHGRDARMTEKLLHRLNARHRYSGEPVMQNGNTEIFTVQVINS